MFRGASLPAGEGPGQDRWVDVGAAAAVLDGASGFIPEVVEVGEYVDQLADQLAEVLRLDPADLVEALGESINTVATRLDLRAGHAPSSTVLIARQGTGVFDVLALGDSTAVVATGFGTIRVTDSRLADIARDVREQYRHRLKDGGGYDDRHRELLRELQVQELAARNAAGGYWIAEADAHASFHAVTRSFRLSDVDWCVLATDGAQRTIDHLGIPWHDIAVMNEDELAAVLHELHRWEAETDPSGMYLPRAKRHDDKVLVAWTPDTVIDRAGKLNGDSEKVR